MIDREELSTLIYNRLQDNFEELKSQYNKTKEHIGYFFIDELLPGNLVCEIYNTFPNKFESVEKKSIREHKFVAFQMDAYNPLLEEIIYAFQEKRVVSLIGEICGTKSLEPDEYLYAGGLSIMEKNNFLRPHLDNSHDKDVNKWRALNLLYYVTPNWKLENGGNLELWPKGIKEKQITIESKFNRLVVMATHNNSWHSVSKVLIDKERCCVSNYYFSPSPMKELDSFHVTSFREKKNLLLDFVLQMDNRLRGLVRKFIKKGIKKTSHQYKK